MSKRLIVQLTFNTFWKEPKLKCYGSDQSTTRQTIVEYLAFNFNQLEIDNESVVNLLWSREIYVLWDNPETDRVLI